MDTMHALSRDEREEHNESLFVENGLSEDGRAVSEEEYWEKHYDHPDFNYEWNNGYLEEKPMADLKGSKIYQCFFLILKCYLNTFPIGAIVNLEIGFRMALPHKTSIRKPDLGVFSNTNPIIMNSEDCSYSGIFDLCVESLSYSSTAAIKRDTKIKKKEYEGAGVKEYYILDARGIKTVFLRLDKNGKYVDMNPGNGDIIRSRVLPGFQFRISDLYREPLLEELAEDDIYHKYVFPSYKKVKQWAEKEKQRAEKEKQRAEKAEKLLTLEQYQSKQEKQRAEKAEEKAERLEARLRELGVSPG